MCCLSDGVRRVDWKHMRAHYDRYCQTVQKPTRTPTSPCSSTSQRSMRFLQRLAASTALECGSFLAACHGLSRSSSAARQRRHPDVRSGKSSRTLPPSANTSTWCCTPSTERSGAPRRLRRELNRWRRPSARHPAVDFRLLRRPGTVLDALKAAPFRQRHHRVSHPRPARRSISTSTMRRRSRISETGGADSRGAAIVPAEYRQLIQEHINKLTTTCFPSSG